MVKWRPKKKNEALYKSDVVLGEGDETQKPTTFWTNRGKWPGATLVEVRGTPGDSVYPGFKDFSGDIMIRDEPIKLDKNGEVVIVFGRGNEDCYFFVCSTKPAVVSIKGYGVRV